MHRGSKITAAMAACLAVPIAGPTAHAAEVVLDGPPARSSRS